VSNYSSFDYQVYHEPEDAADGYRAWVEIERAGLKAKKLLEEQNDEAFGKIETLSEVPAPVEEVVPVEWLASLQMICEFEADAESSVVAEKSQRCCSLGYACRSCQCEPIQTLKKLN
jgi:hypothetical protein